VKSLMEGGGLARLWGDPSELQEPLSWGVKGRQTKLLKIKMVPATVHSGSQGEGRKLDTRIGAVPCPDAGPVGLLRQKHAKEGGPVVARPPRGQTAPALWTNGGLGVHTPPPARNFSVGGG